MQSIRVLRRGGIGPAVARAFAAAGCAGLCITDINAAALQQTAADLQSRNPSTQVLVVPGDISSAEFVESLFAQVKETFGRLDYAVNVAGIGGSGKTSAESSIEEFDKINGVNYRGLWLCSRQEIGMMQKQEITKGERGQRGAIVNIASQLGLVGRPAARESFLSSPVRVVLTSSRLCRFETRCHWPHTRRRYRLFRRQDPRQCRMSRSGGHTHDAGSGGQGRRRRGELERVDHRPGSQYRPYETYRQA